MVPFHSCFCNGIQNKPHPWTLPNEKIVLSKRVSLWIKILLRPDPISRSKYPRQNKLNGTFRRSLSQNALPRLFFLVNYIGPYITTSGFVFFWEFCVYEHVCFCIYMYFSWFFSSFVYFLFQIVFVFIFIIYCFVLF